MTPSNARADLNQSRSKLNKAASGGGLRPPQVAASGLSSLANSGSAAGAFEAINLVLAPFHPSRAGTLPAAKRFRLFWHAPDDPAP
jgi:hypothetical protein